MQPATKLTQINCLIAGVLIFNWVSLVLTVIGMGLLFDPLGSARYYTPCDGGANCREDHHERHVERSRALWQRRIRWLFCWMRPDEHSRTAFHDVASRFIALVAPAGSSTF